jgi:hypothetical protein
MNENDNQIEPDAEAKTIRRLSIEQLWLFGGSCRAIAVELKIVPHTVGQNLRAIRRNYGKRLAISIQKQRAEALAYYEAIYREAMSGWRRSQKAKATLTTTEDGEKPIKKVNRRERGPGATAFLTTTMRARKAIDAIYADKPVKFQRSLGSGPSAELIRPPELSKLNDEEFARVVAIAKGIAYDTIRKHQRRRSRQADRNDIASDEGASSSRPQKQSPGLHPSNDADIPRQLAPHGPGGDARPSAEERMSAADGLHASSARQERTGEPPLPGLSARP